MGTFAIAIFVSIFCANAFGETNRSHEKVNTIGCIDALDNCRKNANCNEAFRKLNKKCKVISGRCGVQQASLHRCGQISDNLFSDHGFSTERCKCGYHNSVKCLGVLNKVYGNPCFDSVRQFRHENKETKTGEKNTKIVSTKTTKLENTASTTKSYSSKDTTRQILTTHESPSIGRQKKVIKRKTKNNPITTTTFKIQTNDIGTKFSDSESFKEDSHQNDLMGIMKIVLGVIFGLSVLTIISLIWIRRKRNEMNKEPKNEKSTESYMKSNSISNLNA